ncbi:unnamed protein product [Paramecium octaurelia]|uniref:Uncharacterized protein n=1 Tax=Paramecium octaurelia TaxID=43137 RepID=A0A8S1U8D2_PAROT|nr:unnamed protein product [Paramecium octaurelia]
MLILLDNANELHNLNILNRIKFYSPKKKLLLFFHQKNGIFYIFEKKENIKIFVFLHIFSLIYLKIEHAQLQNQYQLSSKVQQTEDLLFNQRPVDGILWDALKNVLCIISNQLKKCHIQNVSVNSSRMRMLSNLYYTRNNKIIQKRIFTIGVNPILHKIALMTSTQIMMKPETLIVLYRNLYRKSNIREFKSISIATTELEERYETLFSYKHKISSLISIICSRVFRDIRLSIYFTIAQKKVVGFIIQHLPDRYHHYIWIILDLQCPIFKQNSRQYSYSHNLNKIRIYHTYIIMQFG